MADYCTRRAAALSLLLFLAHCSSSNGIRVADNLSSQQADADEPSNPIVQDFQPHSSESPGGPAAPLTVEQLVLANAEPEPQVVLTQQIPLEQLSDTTRALITGESLSPEPRPSRELPPYQRAFVKDEMTSRGHPHSDARFANSDSRHGRAGFLGSIVAGVKDLLGIGTVPPPTPTPTPEAKPYVPPAAVTAPPPKPTPDIARIRDSVILKGESIYPCCRFCSSSMFYPGGSMLRKKDASYFLKASSTEAPKKEGQDAPKTAESTSPPPSPAPSAAPAGSASLTSTTVLLQELSAELSKRSVMHSRQRTANKCCDICGDNVYDPTLDYDNNDPDDDGEEAFTGGIENRKLIKKFPDPTASTCCRVCPQHLTGETIDARMLPDDTRCCSACLDETITLTLCNKLEKFNVPTGLWWHLCADRH